MYAQRLGVNVEDLLLSQPDAGEQALEIADSLVRSGAIDVLVIDSVAALVPRAELEGEMGDTHVGLQARLMSQALRKLTGSISKSRTIVIFINQIRMKVGVMYGSPETTSGGNALKFYASVRLDIRRIGQIKNGADVVGNQTRVRVVKNKMAPPFKTVEFDIMYGEGISKLGEMLDLGVKHGVIEKAGPGTPTTANGSVRVVRNAKVHLREHPTWRVSSKPPFARLKACDRSRKPGIGKNGRYVGLTWTGAAGVGMAAPDGHGDSERLAALPPRQLPAQRHDHCRQRQLDGVSRNKGDQTGPQDHHHERLTA